MPGLNPILEERCNSCPRKCNTLREPGRKGYCRTGNGFEIAAVCIHRGEEPLISGARGICNVFFTGCNLRCIYCQNHEISQSPSLFFQYSNNSGDPQNSLSDSQLLDQIEGILDQGITHVGFVSPSHVVSQVKSIIQGLQARGRNPVYVWNSNGYDSLETIRSLEGIIGVYLPDFKYMDPLLAKSLSDAADYPAIALTAIREMYRQKGSVMIVNEEGQAESGLLIRHLVLPGHTKNSISVLNTIAEEISTGIHLSLMSQYFPTFKALNDPGMNRKVLVKEYEEVRNAMLNMGFRKGFFQELESASEYLPDFSRHHPFE